MHRELRFTPTADEKRKNIENDPALRGVRKQVGKTLGYLETDLRAKSLQAHEFESLTRRYKRKVFEAYAGAYRVFWHYGPDEIDKNGKHIPIITIVAITPHP